jgi:hypothetical protein
VGEVYRNRSAILKLPKEERRRRYDARRAVANPVHSTVHKAIKRGKLRHPAELLCVDCGVQAEQYDHRKYSEPLNVEPVCRKCNLRRGPAEDAWWAKTA